jgi:hypothetical protein
VFQQERRCALYFIAINRVAGQKQSFHRKRRCIGEAAAPRPVPVRMKNEKEQKVLMNVNDRRSKAVLPPRT